MAVGLGCLADEYDAAQNRGEVVGHGGQRNLPDRKVDPTTADLGLTHKQVHEAPKIKAADELFPKFAKEMAGWRIISTPDYRKPSSPA